jgi:cytoskeletal protein RodZ
MSTVVTKKKSDRKDKVVLNIQRTLCYIVLILLAILCLFSFYKHYKVTSRYTEGILFAARKVVF